ncbi:LCP family protein [Salirhabdus salicampi]|nr:LCP family protein [Salirhabdus salicampi]MCP8617583.1 LCP family protein [Salirhabdus salicampi]
MGQRKGSKKKRIILIIVGILLSLIIGTGVYAFSVYNNVKNTVDEKIHKPVESIQHTPDQKVKIEQKKPLNILLMGVDEREHDRGRADTLILLSINPNISSLQMISIPRDTRTEMVGRGFQDKINHSYAFGGSDMTISTVEQFANVDLDYYVKLNMEGLEDLIDVLGGITVYNDMEWTDSGYYERGFVYKKGEIHLNGEQTMGYVRMRYKDPAGDAGRNKRQRKVIEAIVSQGASVASVTKINDVLDVLGNNVETNLTFDDMKNLMTNYREARKNIKSYQVSGQGIYINDIYYLHVTENEREKVHNMINEFNEKTK